MIVIDIDKPTSCYDCPFFVRSDSPKYPFVDCQFIGRLGSVFNFLDGVPVDCPIKELPRGEKQND